MRRNLLCMMLSLCIFILTACSDTSSASVETVTSTVTTAVSETETETAETSISTESTVTTELTTLPVTETSTEAPSETTESASAETVTETTVSETSASETITETAPPPAESVTTTEKITETEKPPAPVVIPEVKIPLADGTDVVETAKAEIDFSRADEGYISAVYTGKSERAKLRVKCGNLQYDHDLAADGSREFFPLMESGTYSVKIYELVTGKSYGEAASADFDANIVSSTEMYLYPNKYIDFDSKSDCVRKAAELCADAEDEVDRIAEIFGFVSENITYDKKLAATVTSGYIPDPDNTLEKRTGICFDYASLMAAMLRSQGIPTRLVIGYAVPDIYHAWNEIYTDETGWITPELFLKKKGFNIADATFYAGNSDKEKIADYIENDSNYSAMYRY